MPHVPAHPRKGSAAAAPSAARNGHQNRIQVAGISQTQNQMARRSSVPAPVFPEWHPSQRVRQLENSQIQNIRNRLNVEVQVVAGSPPAAAAVESFEDMGLHPNIMQAIAYHNYTSPTPIQAQAMPVALSGRDLVGCAETGSGKTAAFCIPMIHHCLAQPSVGPGDGPLALVLAPTRELAQQIQKEVTAFSASLEGFRSAIVVGGTNMAEQRSGLRSGVEIVVATPGRFIDHLHQRNTSLRRISFVVLDEADRMLDMGFEPQIGEIMGNILPKRHQTLLFSATMREEIRRLAQRYLHEAVQVKVGKVSKPTASVGQRFEKVFSEGEKIDRLLELLVAESYEAQKFGQAQPLTIVFVERQTRCEEVRGVLAAEGLHAVAMHGGRSQGEREEALDGFRNGKNNIMVATDVASRGLDVTGVAHVVNLDLPKAVEDYVHRIGRTGRAGCSGRATSFYSEEDLYFVSQIRKAMSADGDGGNGSSGFGSGKSAGRKKERKDAASAFRESLRGLGESTSIRVEDKYKFMVAQANDVKVGAADDAWDD